MSYGVYSMGLAGWKIWEDPEDSDYLMAEFRGTENPHPARRYKIQYTTSGRAFIRPYGHRIYADEVFRIS